MSIAEATTMSFSHANTSQFSLQRNAANREDIPSILLQLVAERRRRKMTQAHVAEKMGTTASAVARLESGGGKKRHSPSVRTLQSYASAVKAKVKIELLTSEE
ncbi:MAG: Antitoxin HigA1 [Gammaproteobacteria bacterium]|jgi:DNA-binding XRE family transcriptional regulator|nr:Antitoxin HigA1 [Gammaproteobacteria bacterium]